MKRSRHAFATAGLATLALILSACDADDTSDPTATADETSDDVEDDASEAVEDDASAAAGDLPQEVTDRGHLRYCATLDNPPRAFYDTDGELTGFEVELGEEIASRLGVDVEWLQLDFDGLIAALQGEQCDALVQELFINPEREEIIDFIRVTNSAQSLIVEDGNEQQITGLEDLSGKSVAVPNGTTIHTILDEQNEELEAAGEEGINVVVLPTTPETLQQLSASQVDAVGTTHSAAAYYIGLEPDLFEFAGEPFETVANGIGFRKDDTELFDPVSAVFDEIVADGTYDELLEKWNLSDVALH